MRAGLHCRWIPHPHLWVLRQVEKRRGGGMGFYFFFHIFPSGRGKYNPSPPRISAYNRDKRNGGRILPRIRGKRRHGVLFTCIEYSKGWEMYYMAHVDVLWHYLGLTKSQLYSYCIYKYSTALYMQYISYMRI